MTVLPMLDRRSVLGGLGFLCLSFDLGGSSESIAQEQKLPGSLAQNPRLDSWIEVRRDGTVLLKVGKVELGQGILTALAQICAEELLVDISRIRVLSGDTALVPNEGTTAGSFSMPNSGTAVRLAAAEVRDLMLELASKALGEPIGDLQVEDGTVDVPSGQQIAYWDLVHELELERQATGKAELKEHGKYRFVGKSLPRLDLPAKLTGAPIYVQDQRPDGMVHGRVVRPQRYDAKLAAADVDAAKKLPGVLQIVRDGSFLAVIATREEQAIVAAQVLAKSARWEGGRTLPEPDSLQDWLMGQKAKDIVIKDEAKGGGTAATVLEASYFRPYHMHGSIGPSAAVATLQEDGVLLIQTHSQSVFETRAAIAKMLAMDTAKVRLQHKDGSGCYGHNGADDAAADAALLARAMPGKPVRVQWSREDEHRFEPYGSAMVIKLKAGLSGSGEIQDWGLELWSTPHGTRPGGEPGNLLAARYLDKPFAQPVPGNGGPPNYAADRNAIALYSFPTHKVVTHFVTEMPLRVSSTRGLGAYANVFAIESFIDEAAHAAKADPLEYRLRHLQDERARAVLQKAAEAFGWDGFKKAAGRGRGIAFARYKNTAAFTAVAIEVEVGRDSGVVRVVRAVAANDCGQIVNPDGVANQIEGGIVQSLSWSLKEAVQFDAQGIKSHDWLTYPILTFSEVPPIEVQLIDRPGTPFLGTGEASQGPAAGALGNAIFDATGVRFRELPFTPPRIKSGLDA